MEFQARLSDQIAIMDLPIEETNRARALLRAYKARYFIQERFRAVEDKPLTVLSVAEVIRHDQDFIEHQIIWDNTSGFTKPKEARA